MERTPSYAFALLSPPSTIWSAFDIDDVDVDDVVVDDVDDGAPLCLAFLGSEPQLALVRFSTPKSTATTTRAQSFSASA